ncbi:single-stranded-DNA-specific exonuclease RecJ [Nisaea acidiphila]|uniref:single-stranded-DNA-specific exonuclease RecJ n=1 Tax=Nisaea acidiphila TaxID=1862145 RepID=UPI0027E34CD9|nr:single-stranded-DNA-specific exonuclease RecJ [Nisaea acidiphila]
MKSFLGVERSFTGKRWVPRHGTNPETERIGLAIAQRFGFPELVGRLIAARQIGLDEVESYLDPTLKSLMPDPGMLQDMTACIARLERAIRDGERIAVFSDYDVDGATSAAILIRYLRWIGVDPLLYVPDRVSEGYGPNTPALLKLKEQGAKLIVTLDCGVTAYEPLSAAAAAGLDVVVVDHHMAEPELPKAVAVVNPNRIDEDGTLGHLAACGVTFLVTVALNRALRENGYFSGKREPNLLHLLDLVALGTVCDVVPLKGLNRAFVIQGLKVMAQRGNKGIVALSDVAGVDARPEPYHLGYVLGPRVNAGGRIGQSDLGARLLLTDSEAEASSLAAELERFNAERREVEANVLAEAEALAADQPEELPAVVVAGEGWHPGVIGIVAGRLKERFNRPACVIALENGIGKGSGRSVPGVSLGPAVIAAHQAGLLLAGGGHAMAAGFTIEADKLDAFRGFLGERIHSELEGEPLVPTLSVDAPLAAGGASRELADTIQKVGPFGAGNSEPRFVLSDVRVVDVREVGTGHVRCFFAGADGKKVKGIAFRALEGDLGPALMKSSGRPIHVAGHLRPDDWNGRSDVQILIDDAAEVG